MPKCDICGKEVANPEAPAHVNSKFHQEALKAAEEPKKEETKPKEESKPAPKEEKKPAPKVETKTKPKTEPKKEKPKTKGPKTGKDKVTDGLKKAEDFMAKQGYMDLWDYFTLTAGVLGLIFTLVGFVSFLGGGILPDIGAAGFTSGFLTTEFNNALRDLGLYVMMIWIYLNLMLYPFIIKGLWMKLVEKFPNTFPLRFIKTPEDFRIFIIFLSFWSCVFFWAASPSFRVVHFFMLVITLVVMFGAPIGAKTKMPAKKTL